MLASRLSELEATAANVRTSPPHAEVFICIPPTLIFRAVQVATDPIAIGSQDFHAENLGAFIGDTSVDMPKDAGATTAIVGHSESWRYHQETDAMPAAKAAAARRPGLSAIVCNGGMHAQRRAGRALSACNAQIAGSLPAALARSATAAVGNEPLWAIGTGQVPTSAQIARMHHDIGSCLTKHAGTAGCAFR